jgi:hypothetical protein
MTTLLDAMEKCLNQCHLDEQAGVPIGAREMALVVLAHIGIDPGELPLGRPYDLPADWARKNCTNPVRRSRDQAQEKS